jgi:hypothetical protein
MLSDPSVTILMYFVLPVWFIAGFADWICHRATSIETASGVKESAIHALMWALGECVRTSNLTNGNLRCRLPARMPMITYCSIAPPGASACGSRAPETALAIG